MRPTVYVETTIPSYYWDVRQELSNEIKRTRQWWDEERGEYDCYVSQIVLAELKAGQYKHQNPSVELVGSLPLLSLTDEILDIADVYQKRHLMPLSPPADSIHLALASYYRMDYLLTWNCRHLANATKVRHLEHLNQGMGLSVPVLATPYMLQIV